MTQDTDEIMQFPCEIAIKAMGKHEPDFEEIVVEIVARHIGELESSCISSRPSKGGNFIAITVRVQAESREQMDRIYHELSAHERVSIAL